MSCSALLQVPLLPPDAAPPTSRCLFSFPILISMSTPGPASFQISPSFPHCCCRPLLDLPSPFSLLLPPPSRSPLSFLTAAAAPLLDPHARFPCCCTSRARTEGDTSRNGSLALPGPPPVLPLSLLPPLLSHFADFGRGIQDAQGFSSAWTPMRRLGDALKTMIATSRLIGPMATRFD